MEITNVSVMPLTHGKFDCIAICQFELDSSFIITGLKLYEKNGKRCIVFPKNEHNRKQMKYCHPVNDDVYNRVLDKIVAEYDRLCPYDQIKSEDKWYKARYGEGLAENYVNTLTEAEKIREAERLKKVAASLEQSVSKDGQFKPLHMSFANIENMGKTQYEDIQEYCKKYDEEHPEIADDLSDEIPDGITCIDNEELVKAENQAVQDDFMYIIQQYITTGVMITPDIIAHVKYDLMQKYPNSHTAISDLYPNIFPKAFNEEKETN